jgi:site-specific DNA recombinase
VVEHNSELVCKMDNELRIVLKRAVGYLRYSDIKQEGNNSIEIQKSSILAKAKFEGYEIVEWRTDAAVSAYRTSIEKRKGLKLIFEDIQNGVTGIFFYDESRATRAIYDFYKYVYIPIKDIYPHVNFYSTQTAGIWDPNSPLVQTKLLYANEESVIKGTRAVDAMHSILKGKKNNQPKRPGSKSPSGYVMKDGYLEISDDADIVRLIFHLYLWGHSEKKIAEYLNANNLYPISCKEWYAGSVGYILQNPVYLGHLTWNIKSKEGTTDYYFNNLHEPIISPHLFSLVQNLLKVKTSAKFESPFLFNELLYCSTCKEKLKTKNNTPKNNKKKYLYYVCASCKGKIPIENLHDSLKVDISKRWFHNINEMQDKSHKILNNWVDKFRNIKSELEDNGQQIKYNLSFSEADPELVDVFTKSLSENSEQINEINRIWEEVVSLSKDENLLPFLFSLKEIALDQLETVELRALLNNMVESINIDLKAKKVSSIKYRLNPFYYLDERATSYIT